MRKASDIIPSDQSIPHDASFARPAPPVSSTADGTPIAARGRKVRDAIRIMPPALECPA
jgi:hypothetical protein